MPCSSATPCGASPARGCPQKTKPDRGKCQELWGFGEWLMSTAVASATASWVPEPERRSRSRAAQPARCARTLDRVPTRRLSAGCLTLDPRARTPPVGNAPTTSFNTVAHPLSQGKGGKERPVESSPHTVNHFFGTAH